MIKFRYDHRSDPSFSSEDLTAAFEGFKSAVDAAWARHRQMVEAELVKRLEILIGRVPSNDEVKARLMEFVWPDGRSEFKWGRDTILTVSPPSIFKPLPTP